QHARRRALVDAHIQLMSRMFGRGLAAALGREPAHAAKVTERRLRCVDAAGIGRGHAPPSSHGWVRTVGGGWYGLSTEVGTDCRWQLVRLSTEVGTGNGTGTG